MADEPVITSISKHHFSLLARSIICLFEPPTHIRSHVARYETPAAEENNRQMSNIKHAHAVHTQHTQPTFSGLSWGQTCDRCSSKDLRRHSAFKLLTSVPASRYSPYWADSVNWIGFHNAVRPSADSESCGQQHEASIKETSKPEQRERTRRPSRLQRGRNTSIFMQIYFSFNPALPPTRCDTKPSCQINSFQWLYEQPH